MCICVVNLNSWLRKLWNIETDMDLDYAASHTHIQSPLQRHLLVYTVLMGANNGPVLGLQWKFMMDVRKFNWE